LTSVFGTEVSGVSTSPGKYIYYTGFVTYLVIWRHFGCKHLVFF